jgi:tripartite ATP-independent transporter DctM subunit
MSVTLLGFVLLGGLGALLAAGLWIGFALAIVAWLGMVLASGSPPGLNLVTATWASAASWELAALPLFVWMGEILFRTRLSEQMFKGLAPWMAPLPGGLLHVNVLGSGIFGLVSGSSAATCATISKIALPELSRRGYPPGIAIGTLAGSGTLGILIPPSVIMVVYAVAANVSVIQVFLAGLVPGLMMMLLFHGYVAAWGAVNARRVPPGEPRLGLREKLRNSRELIPCLLLIATVMGSIVGGLATATESAAFGVAGALAIAAFGGSLDRASFMASLHGATRMSCVIMFILGTAAFLTVAMGFTGVPRALAEHVAAAGLSKYELIAVLVVLYVMLGMFLDGVSMIVLTTSIVLPMVQAVGIDLIWFGIFIVLLVEIAAVTPPVGFNLFVLQSMSGRDATYVARQALPFFGLLVVAIVLLTLFPDIATWLPQLVMAREV